MTIKEFFAQCKEGTIVNEPIILFTGKEYPVLLFSMLLLYLRTSCQLFPKKIIFQELSSAALHAQVATTFLGQKDILWLADISEIEDTALKKQVFSLCKNYKGPHALWGFVSSDDAKEIKSEHVINLDDLSEGEKKVLFSEFFPESVLVRAQEFLKQFPKASLDQTIMIFYYTAVVSKNTHLAFKEQWLSKIIASESSLFELSQYFFARKSEQFWKVWQNVKEQYGAPFWTVFWSEQLYRAHYVIELYKQNRIVEAKQLSFKLPFSFLQKDWKQISLQELQQAHDFLYQGDCATKNGSSDYFLEVFYASFLTKSFSFSSQ